MQRNEDGPRDLRDVIKKINSTLLEAQKEKRGRKGWKADLKKQCRRTYQNCGEIWTPMLTKLIGSQTIQLKENFSKTTPLAEVN